MGRTWSNHVTAEHLRFYGVAVNTSSPSKPPRVMASTIAYFSIPPRSTSNFCCSFKTHFFGFVQLPKVKPRRRRIRRELKRAAAMFSGTTVVSDAIATGLSGGIALSLLKIWEQTAKRGVFDQVDCFLRFLVSSMFMLANDYLSCLCRLR